uniref:Uncharacterized protein n=1 Tax=Glossina austeni TaxID=7395 RepID=A0A1A9UEF5_GLOAU
MMGTISFVVFMFSCSFSLIGCVESGGAVFIAFAFIVVLVFLLLSLSSLLSSSSGSNEGNSTDTRIELLSLSSVLSLLVELSLLTILCSVKNREPLYIAWYMGKYNQIDYAANID